MEKFGDVNGVTQGFQSAVIFGYGDFSKKVTPTIKSQAHIDKLHASKSGKTIILIWAFPFTFSEHTTSNALLYFALIVEC